MTLASLVLILTYLLGVFSSDGESIYHNGFGYSCNDRVSNCLPNKCIYLREAPYCVECKSEYVPINGKCVSVKSVTSTGTGCVKSSAGGWCTGCNDGYFLFYGGCWVEDTQKPIICRRAEKGLCKECVTESLASVFTNPNTTAPERCIYCGDPIGFGGYNGVYSCQNCRQPRLPGTIEADCYGCLQQEMCSFDYRCKPASGLASLGYCMFCPTTHVWSDFACYAIGGATGDSVCLLENIIEIQNRSLCTRCTNPLEAPQDGRCLSISRFSDVCIKDPEKGQCISCKDRDAEKYFLFYGGCLRGDILNKIGSQVCQEVRDNVCITCNSSTEEVFTGKNGCWRCGDSANGGIDGCQRCKMGSDGLQCLECRDLYLSLNKKSCLAGCPRGQRGVRDPSSSIHSCTCDDGFYLKDGGCVKCTVENCAKCDKSACNECMYGYALFNNQCKETRCKDPNCDICEERDVCTRCAGDHSLDQNGLCVKDCLSSAGYYKDIVGGVSRCVKCTLDGCATCESADKCKTCKNEFYLESQEGCKPCSSECATCSGSTTGDCTSCPAGKRLQYSDSDGTKGSCVSQCVKDNSCAACGLTIDGTSYCSQCVKSTEYPRNGVCTSTNSRATGITCTTVVDGQCIVCGSSSFRLNGGCYTSKLLPGKAVCTTESNGWCDSTVAGYGITYNGTLRTCPENCKVCTDGSCSSCNRGFYPENGVCNPCPEGCATCPHGKACFDCLAGYYFSENICKACHKAIPNCNLCMVPDDAMNPVCLDHNNTSRKSALSAKAISGIAIGAVVVVGTVAAVLVWLFVFRKKN